MAEDDGKPIVCRVTFFGWHKCLDIYTALNNLLNISIYTKNITMAI